MSTDHLENVMRPEVRSNFSKIPNQLIINEKLAAYEKLIAIYIMSYKVCFVSQQTMARDLGLSRSTVQRNMSALIKKNVVRKVNKSEHGWDCVYVVNSHSKWELGE